MNADHTCHENCPDQGGTEVCDDCQPDCPCYGEKPLRMTQALYLQQQVEIERLRETVGLARDREWEARIEACALRGREARQSGEITRLLARVDAVKALGDRAWEAVAALGECDVKFRAPYINLQRALGELRLEHSDPDWEWTWPKEYETGYDIRKEET